MYNFKYVQSVVKAIRIGKSGIVVVDGKQLYGNCGYWVIIKNDKIKTMSDEEFKDKFEPADEEASMYIKKSST